MKWMKWLLVLAVGIGVALGTVGCDDDDDDDGGSGDPLVGTWTGTAFNGLPLPAGIGIDITLRDNGTASGTSMINGVEESYNGTWSASGGTLSITDADGTELLGYTVEGNTLTITDEAGAFTLKRQ